MKRLVLFSMPTEEITRALVALLFPNELRPRVFAYMPAEGNVRHPKHVGSIRLLETIARQHQAEFLLIDNAAENSAAERAKLSMANILLISGGNVCVLLQNLRNSGLDRSILEMVQKPDYVLAGYSAGAMILTPSVQYADFAFGENQNVGLKDLRALQIVDYEIAPHHTPEFQTILTAYRQQCPREIKALADDELILIER